MSVLQMRTIRHEMEILASGGQARACNTRMTLDFPNNLRETLKQKCVGEFLEGFVFSDSYVTIFKKSLPWIPLVIVLVSREDICFISHYEKRPQRYDHRMLAELRHCQTLLWTCLPQLCVMS